MPMMASARLERSTLGRKAAAGWTRPGELMRASSVVTSLLGENHGTKAGHRWRSMTKWCCCPEWLGEVRSYSSETARHEGMPLHINDG
jgi:hypothetical protein